MRRVYLFLFSAILLPALAHAAPAFIEPEGELYTTDDGTVALAWEPGTAATEEDDIVYQVYRSQSPDFADSVYVYEGEDTASFVSGLPEGDFYFKIRSKPAGGEYPEWSNNYLQVTVKYTEPGLVVLLMSLGLITFIAIVVSISLGHRRASRESAANAA